MFVLRLRQNELIAGLTAQMLVTLIPAKPFRQSKTRLTSILSSDQRAKLSQMLLRRTITVAKEVSEVVVVSRSASVRRVAKGKGAWALTEHYPDLNEAIRQGMEWAEFVKSALAVLILPLDLPLLRLEDIQAMIKMAGLPNVSSGLSHISPLSNQPQPMMIIAPCQHQTGTNALLLKPPTFLSPQFGPNSFQAHLVAAEALSLQPQIYHSPTLALDLDTPQDWNAILTYQSALVGCDNQVTTEVIEPLIRRFV